MLRIATAAGCLVFLLGIGPALAEPTPPSEPTDHAHHSHHEHFGGRADGHAPIGVMGDHLHGAGEVMLSYRYGRMQMRSNFDGSEQLRRSEVFDLGFAATPTDMTMEMHMFGAMYAPSDWLTLMLMIPYVELEMDHVTAMGGRFRTEANGLGDIKVSGLLRLFQTESHGMHLNFGISTPTGDIDVKDNVLTPMGPARLRLPYPMQLGSGTWDAMPGITYAGHFERLSFGAQVMGRIPMNENSNDYRLGKSLDATGWLALSITDWLSTSVRLGWKSWSNIRGADPRLVPSVIPTADPNRRAGERLELLPGINVVVPLGPLGSHRLAVELGVPVYEDLDGPQLGQDWRVIVGWQKALEWFAH